jgi:hypothetical protein
MTDTIVPKQVTELRAVPAEDINKMADQVLEATLCVNRSNEALEDLSASLVAFKKAKDTYDRMAPQVKQQMRNIVTRL